MRRALVALVTALVVVAGAGPALAATTAVASTAASPSTAAAAVDTCRRLSAGYAAAGTCQLVVAEAQGICVAGTPVLEYAVQPEGTPNDTVTITWINPDGADVVQSGLPLSGQLLWPGTVVQDGVTVDWPGWTHEADGTWTQSDAYSWTRPEVQVLFEVNPSATTTVSYPPESGCADPVRSQVLAAEGIDDPGSTDGTGVTSAVLGAGSGSAALGTGFTSAVLAATGMSAAPVVAVGAGLLVLGALLVLAVARRRRLRHIS